MKRLLSIAFRWLRRGLRAGAIVFIFVLVAFLVAWIAFPFPADRLDRWPSSPRVLDRHGEPMLQLVGVDDQWRMPVALDEVSPWLIEATLAVEDARFRSHVGVDPMAVLRAAAQNLGGGRVVSGASTLSMQVCRMMDDRPRTWRAKITEAFRALQLEHELSKDRILEVYLNIAPYGGNIRGVEAASRLYFHKRAKDLSLAEAALIAGLPQSPSRLRPDRHPDRAKARQAVVLGRMVECAIITEQQADGALNQKLTIAGESLALRQPAGSPAGWLAVRRRAMGGRTTIDLTLQREVDRLSREHLSPLPAGTDAAVVVIDITTGDLLAMIGTAGGDEPGRSQVNAAIARRSPGSALKPFIYAAGFESRRLNEDSILFDGPIERGGWSPMNFDRTFAGEVTVAQALRRSLNVPAILVAEGVGLRRCVGVVEAAGVTLPDDAAARGGLAVATGAVEVTLLDLANAYATLGRGGVRQSVRLFADEPAASTRALSPRTCGMLDDILGSPRRRPRGMESLDGSDVPWFMWKTGTSSGRRDAWALGHNGKVAIGVWIGRNSGSGDAALVGGETAEPLLARLFDLPAWRVTNAPPATRSWPVTQPLPRPIEQSEQLRINSPAKGSRFIAVGGSAVIRPACNRAGPMLWFLNGRLLDERERERLLLSPGGYELRCVEPDGLWAKTEFEVK
jgi:penicillin-binding protein 1C